MYEEALRIMKEEGFPPQTREGLPVLCHRDLYRLSKATGEQMSKLAFYFAEEWRK